MAQQQGSSESAVNQAISNLLKYAPDRIGGGDRKADDEYLDVQPYQLLWNSFVSQIEIKAITTQSYVSRCFKIKSL
jgi:hypothetical protein